MTKDRGYVLGVRLLGVAALLVFTRAIMHHMTLAGGGPGALFGSLHAPYSDALGPWLRGGITFHLYETIEPFVYRPTLALFYASAFTVANRIEVIPVASAALLLTLLALVLVVRTPGRAALAAILTVAVLGISHRGILSHLSIGSINIDFPLFALILGGVVLIVIALERNDADRPLLLAGFLCLGVGAALRGTVLLGGLMALAMLAAVRPRIEVRSVLLLTFAFLSPSVVDSLLARQHGTLNNGVIALFCVYDDPSHSWTSPCHGRYLAQRPSGADVTAGYRQFVMSAKGVRLVANNARYRLLQDGRPLSTKLFLGAAGALLGLRTWRLHRRSGHWRQAARDRPLMLGWAVLALVAASIVASVPDMLSGAVLLALAGSTLLRMRAAACALLIYAGGVITLSLIFLTLDRVGASFSFCLPLGLLLIFVGPSQEQEAAADARRCDTTANAGAATLVTVAIAFLYLGSHVMPSPARDTFRSTVEGRSAALKLSDDPHLGLSLYLFPRGHLGYAVLDHVPIGAVRRYDRLEPGNLYNDSFSEPNRFVEVR